MDNYNAKIEALEKEELEQPSSDVNLYVKLMAYYLVQHKLFDAKFLWSRIPESMKKENAELQILNKLEKSLVSNNHADVFENINKIEWNEDIRSVMNGLKEFATRAQRT